MEAYKKLNISKSAALNIEFTTEPADEKAELTNCNQRNCEKMERIGDKFISMKQNESIRSVFSKEFYFTVLLIVSTYMLLNGGAFSWVGLVGFVGSVLLVILAIIWDN